MINANVEQIDKNLKEGIFRAQDLKPFHYLGLLN